MSIDINSLTQSSAELALYAFYTKGPEKSGITHQEALVISSKFKIDVNAILNNVSLDENAYVGLDLDEKAEAKAKGKAEIAEEVGHDGDLTSEKVSAGADTAMVTTSLTFSLLGNGLKGAVDGVKNGILGYKNMFTKIGGETVEKTVEKVSTAGQWSAFAAAALAIATVVKYWIERPNKAVADLIANLQTQMTDAQSELATQQENMDVIADSIIEEYDKAYSLNVANSDDIVDASTQIMLMNAIVKKYDDKLANGEQLDKAEWAEYNEAKQLVLANQEITETKAGEIKAGVNEHYSAISAFSSDYENIDAITQQIIGKTDYAAALDEATRVMCNVEGAMQIANAVSGAIAGARLMAYGPWGIALGATVLGGTVFSGYKAASEQFSWAKMIKTEIEARVQTQDITTATQDMLTAETEGLAYVQGAVVKMGSANGLPEEQA